jgi:hypothetical protein
MLTMTQRAKTPLKDQSERVFQALKQCGPGWHSRDEIAKVLGKRRLNPAEVVLLNLLVENDRIEATRIEIEGPAALQWVYRVKE